MDEQGFLPTPNVGGVRRMSRVPPQHSAECSSHPRGSWGNRDSKRKGHHKNKESSRQVMGLPGSPHSLLPLQREGPGPPGSPPPHSSPPMGPGCPSQPEHGQASPLGPRLPDEALQPSAQGPSCQGQRGWRGACPWMRTQEPPGGRCLLQQTATNNRCARVPAGRATRRPTPRSSES